MDSETLVTSCLGVAEKAPTATGKTSRSRIVAEFVLIGLVYASGHLGQWRVPIKWGEVNFEFGNLHVQPPGLALWAGILLWFNGGFRLLNFSWPANWKRSIGLLVLVAVAFYACSELVDFIIYQFSGAAPDQRSLKRLFILPQWKYFWALVLFPIWAVAEEFFYRAYLILRIGQLCEPWRRSTLLASVVSSLVFAADHLQYGAGGFPFFFLSSLMYAGIYLYTGRSLWFVSIVHYLRNTGSLVWQNMGI